MIYVGIDDTDTLDTPGTNQLARALVPMVAGDYQCVFILRHQLLYDPRVPYTSKNGSASILLQPRGSVSVDPLVRTLRTAMFAWFKEGSDPGLCVTTTVPPAVTDFGRRCQREIIRQDEARHLAAAEGLHLEGLGGTQDGVIGALAAVGLAATGDDGRVVQLGGWPDDLTGPQDVAALHARGIVVQSMQSCAELDRGTVDVGKHLRPNLRGGRVVLFVTPATMGDADPPAWQAVRMT